MQTLAADLSFQTGPIWVRREVLGTTYSIDREGCHIQLDFPNEEDAMVGRVRTEHPVKALTVETIRVRIEYQGRDLDDHEAFERATELAADAVDDLIEWVKSDRWQTWLRLTGERVRRPTTGEVRNSEGQTSNRTLEIPYRSPIPIFSNNTALSASWLTRTASQLEGRALPPIEDQLATDAYRLCWLGGPHNVQRAVLLAAIACEVNLKETLRATAPSPVRPVLDLIFDGRSAPLPARTLFDKLAKAVVGQSFREDNPDAYKRLDRLFERRNEIAHGGEVPDEHEGRDLVGVVPVLLNWLGRIGAGAGETPI